ncbi:UNVERIFIED_CONTAM: hypothetical protein HDU68_001910, partial [Siphonaria sp. JEL0065]
MQRIGELKRELEDLKPALKNAMGKWKRIEQEALIFQNLETAKSTLANLEDKSKSALLEVPVDKKKVST